MNTQPSARGGYIGHSLNTIVEFLKSLSTGIGQKDGRVLSGVHEAKLNQAVAHLRQANGLMTEVLDAHTGNLSDRAGTVDEPETADPMPMKGTHGTKSNRWIFQTGGR